MAKRLMTKDKKDLVLFRQKIGPLGEGKIVERIKANGTIEELRVRFYLGQEMALQIRPLLVHKGHKQEEFFTYAEGSTPYLAGEDDYFVFTINMDVEYDDEIWLFYENTDALNTYDLSVDIVIDYMAGTDRAGAGATYA